MTGAGKSEEQAADSIGLDADMISRISRLMNLGGEMDSSERALLQAMYPYLSEKRRVKMDKALKIAKLARIARIAIEESEGNA